jgi:hypothetical protein
VGQVNEDRPKTRELIDTALRELGLEDKDEKWAVKRALVQVALLVRNAHRAENADIGREDLRTSLKKIQDTANNLRTLLNRPEVEKAIMLAWASRDVDDDSLEVFAALDAAPNSLRELRPLLNIVATSVDAATSKLALSGKGGHGPWSRFELPSKQVMALSVARLFQFIRGSNSLPGPNNKKYVAMLGPLWEAATRITEEGNWSTTIKAARLKRGNVETKQRIAPAYISARLKIQNIIGEIAGWIEGRRNHK